MDKEKQIEQLNERIKQLEADKAWGKSWIRIIIICVSMYGILLLYKFLVDSFIVDFTNIFFLSAVPIIGFLISSRSLNLIRNLWNKRKEKKKTNSEG